MEGKQCLVTGATSGIGKSIATSLAEMGAEVILVSRNENKCQQAVENIQKQTSNPRISYFRADLSSQEDIKQNYSKLDILVNNAGGFFWRRVESVDGIEMTFALNHLSYFLLTNLLLDILSESPSARIINVSSGNHKNQQLDFNNLQYEKDFRFFNAYGKSKLANLYFTYELARRLSGKKITVNAFNPGFTATNIVKGMPMGNSLMPLANIFAKPVVIGAETGVYLANSKEMEGVTGKYFFKKKPTPSSEISYDTEIANRLWTISNKLVGFN